MLAMTECQRERVVERVVMSWVGSAVCSSTGKAISFSLDWNSLFLRVCHEPEKQINKIDK